MNLSICKFLKESYRVSWADLCFIKHNIASILVSTLISPILYIVAFGYGLGSNATVDDISYISYVIPGIVAMSTVSSCFSTTANKVFIQRRFHDSFSELLMAPVSRAALVMGKSIVGVVKGIMSATILTVIGLILSDDMNVTVAYVMMILLSCFLFSFMGILAGLLANSHPQINLFSSLFILPMTFLCGTVFSLDATPDWFQYVVAVLPLTYVSETIRASSLGWGVDPLSVLVVVAFAVAMFLISWSMLVKGSTNEEKSGSRMTSNN